MNFGRVKRHMSLGSCVVAVLLARSAAPQDAAKPETRREDPSISAGFPLKFTASLTVRQDFTDINDQNDLLVGDDRIDGLRSRIRFGIEAARADALVGGGIRFSTGETPNPASPFIRLGDALRPSTFNVDRYYITIKPLKERDRVVLNLGKVPQPLYRPGAGTWRSELMWDDDISPSGASLQTRLHAGGDPDRPVRLENTLAYFVLEDVTNTRFSGITGSSYMAGDQMKLTVSRLEVAAGYFQYFNLNVGLRSPNFTPGEGAFLLPGTSPLLLGPGLQHTNNSVNYGPGADGFVADDFKIWNASFTYRHRLPVARLGRPEAFLAGDATRNSGVRLDRSSYALTIGVTGGGWTGGPHPYTVHATWRDVGADAVLSTFADSDLGAGSSYRGFEIGANYRVAKNLLGLFQCFNFDGFPRKDERVRRFFFDLVWDF